ncbi:MAG: 3,4-dioxygenase subunit beta, partial [Corynebacterium casei]|nr:3,4-dioxygenase subunit beta [Corynebacterium casei]MDN6693821.1 3,4-dioxygenase subunit beta [Corynebacterium casei]
LSQITLDTDNVFSDGWEQQAPDVVGNATDGFSLAITVPVDLTTQSEASSMGGGMGGGEMSGGMPGGNPPQGGMAPPSQ